MAEEKLNENQRSEILKKSPTAWLYNYAGFMLLAGFLVLIGWAGIILFELVSLFFSERA